jgi:hypothetical protein
VGQFEFPVSTQGGHWRSEPAIQKADTQHAPLWSALLHGTSLQAALGWGSRLAADGDIGLTWDLVRYALIHELSADVR